MRLRSLLRPVLRHIYAPIPGGPNMGLKCSIACGMAYRAGTYENSRWTTLAPLIHAGDVFWDVGAHYGYVTLLAHRAVGASGTVFAFEPFARNRAFLKGHVKANRANNVTVLPLALADFEGVSRFGGGKGSGTRHLGVGHRQVEVDTIDHLVASGRCEAPTWLKLDVEGAESTVLAGGEQTLRAHPARVLVATHSNEQHDLCLGTLGRLGYTCHVPERSIEALAGGPRHLETEILAIGPGLEVPEEQLQAFLSTPARE